MMHLFAWVTVGIIVFTLAVALPITVYYFLVKLPRMPKEKRSAVVEIAPVHILDDPDLDQMYMDQLRVRRTSIRFSHLPHNIHYSSSIHDG